jgi:hypothetical protein
MGDKTTKGIIGGGAAGLAVIAMLLLNGTTVWECSNGQTGIFDNLEQNNTVGVWTDEDDNPQRAFCKTGWEKTSMTPEELEKALNDPVVNLQGWSCSSP